MAKLVFLRRTEKEIEIFEKTKADVASAGIEFKNDMDVIRVTMHEPTLDDTMPDLERLTWAVEDVCGTDHIKVPFIGIKIKHWELRL